MVSLIHWCPRLLGGTLQISRFAAGITDGQPDKVRRMDLLFRPALELAAMIRSGELSARELVSASIARIEALEPTINAFTHVAYDSAVHTADAIKPGDPRPFAGV